MNFGIKSKYKPPNIEERFTEIITVPFNLEFDNPEDAQEFYKYS